MSTAVKELTHSVTVHGYSPIVGQRIPDGLIRIEGHFPEAAKYREGEQFKDWERRERKKFVVEASAIFDVLSNNLPGGTLHELTIMLLQRKLNLYVVKE